MRQFENVPIFKQKRRDLTPLPGAAVSRCQEHGLPRLKPEQHAGLIRGGVQLCEELRYRGLLGLVEGAYASAGPEAARYLVPSSMPRSEAFHICKNITVKFHTASPSMRIPASFQ